MVIESYDRSQLIYFLNADVVVYFFWIMIRDGILGCFMFDNFILNVDANMLSNLVAPSVIILWFFLKKRIGG